MNNDFEPFPKIARLKRELAITEKLDGTNAQVFITHPDSNTDPNYVLARQEETGLVMLAGSRKRYIAPEGSIQGPSGPLKGTDNFGFAAWVAANTDDLFQMGEGRHYGEWYGQGIQRGYDLEEKRFALFNVARWGEHNPNTPACCEVVTKLPDEDPDDAMGNLKMVGSFHVPGFMDPEGIVVWHPASRTLYKQTFDNDGGKWTESKSQSGPAAAA